MPVGQTQTETQPKAGGFIISEANHTRSRATGTILSGQDLAAGAVLGIVTGKYQLYDDSATGAQNTAVAILYDAVDATGGDVTGATIIIRDCEVNNLDLGWGGQTATEITNGITDLASVGIIVRDEL